MIYFELPDTTKVYVDRNPTEEHSINMLEFGNLTKQARSNGINTKDINISFKICCSSYAELNAIVSFFNTSVNVPFLLYYNFGSLDSKKVVITNWNITARNSLYGDIIAQAKLVYP
jgi:hypothetical protein